MGIRPEDIHLDIKEEIDFEGEVVLVEPMGASNLVSVNVKGRELKILSHKLFEIREIVTLSFSPHQAYFFDTQNGLRLRFN
jgi:ABC-type sugar transport system ATPase subunit